MKTILITGGAGFIGNNFVRYMLRCYPHFNVTVLDKLTYAGNEDNLLDVRDQSNFSFVKGDICDSSLVNELVSKSNSIVHFAAETHVDRSIQNASAFITTNVYGTNVLLEAVRNHSIDRFIHISTDEVYGSRESGSFSEEDPLNPSNPYSASKAAADLLVLSFSKTYGVPVVIVRSSNVFGPHQYPEKLIPLFATNALEGKELPVYGDGLNIRDWIYVEDLCEAIDVVQVKGRTGEIYNVGAANERTNLEIAYSILDTLGKSRNLLTYVSDRPAHDKRYSLDWAKIGTLGWQPRHTFMDALRQTILWYQEKEWWWQKIKEKKQLFQEFYKRQYPTLVSS